MAKAKILKKTFKKLLKSRIVTGLVGSLLYFYTRLVGRTTRWKTKGIGKFYDCWRKEGSIILIGWHGRAMLYPYFWNKKRPLNALVSLHQDGRLIAGFLENADWAPSAVPATATRSARRGICSNPCGMTPPSALFPTDLRVQA